jgi:hypothetical protein
MNTEEHLSISIKMILDIFAKFKRENSFKDQEVRRMVFEKYLTIFHPHFITWLAVMQNSCNSAAGGHASKDNLMVELTGNH